MSRFEDVISKSHFKCCFTNICGLQAQNLYRCGYGYLSDCQDTNIISMFADDDMLGHFDQFNLDLIFSNI